MVEQNTNRAEFKYLCFKLDEKWRKGMLSGELLKNSALKQQFVKVWSFRDEHARQ